MTSSLLPTEVQKKISAKENPKLEDALSCEEGDPEYRLELYKFL